MKRKLTNIFVSCLIALAVVLPASALIHTPGDGMFIGGLPGVDYSWGVFGAVKLGGFDPASLDPYQWLYLFTSPATATDKTPHERDADYRESTCATFNGVDEFGQITASKAAAVAAEFSYSNSFVMGGILTACANCHIWSSAANTADRCFVSFNSSRLLIGHFTTVFDCFRADAALTIGENYTWRWEHGAGGSYNRLYINNVEVLTSIRTEASVSSGAYIASNGGASGFYAGYMTELYATVQH